MNLTFNMPTRTEYNITVPIHNDDIVETVEFLFVHLNILSATTTSVVILNPNRAAVFIRSEDRMLAT